MNLNRGLLFAAALLALAVVAFGLWSGADPVAPPLAQERAAMPADSGQVVLPPSGVVAAPTPPAQDSPLPALQPGQVDAVASLEQARLHGDARAPAVVRDAPREAPSAAELADPDAYQRYENRQNQRLYKAYVKAADDEIPRLQKDIAQAREQGLSAEQLQEGEEKLRRIQSMRDQLQADHPETAAAP